MENFIHELSLHPPLYSYEWKILIFVKLALRGIF